MTVVKTTLFALMLAAGAAVAGEATPPAARHRSHGEARRDGSRHHGSRRQARQAQGLRATSRAHACDRARPTARTTSRPLRTYTQEDLQRTGEIDMNQALRKLDPIFH